MPNQSGRGASCTSVCLLDESEALDALLYGQCGLWMCLRSAIHHVRQRELDRRRSASEFAPLYTRDTPVRFHLQILKKKKKSACDTPLWCILAERTHTSPSSSNGSRTNLAGFPYCRPLGYSPISQVGLGSTASMRFKVSLYLHGVLYTRALVANDSALPLPE